MVSYNDIIHVKNIKNIFNSQKNKSICLSLNTDTRIKKEDSFFVAIKGEKFNALSFLEDICSNHKVLVYNSIDHKQFKLEEVIAKYTNVTFIQVENTIEYLQELSSIHYCSWYNERKFVIGIAGSNGKTTTKEMLKHLFEFVVPNKTIATFKNDNNHLGVPFTILKLSSDHDYLILELGSNHPGEMKVICDLIKFDVAIVTNIGHTHMEFFETLDDVYNEESYVYQRMNHDQKSLFLKNEDCEYLRKLESKSWVKSFSCEKKVELYYNVKTQGKINLKINEEDLELKNISLLGRHNFINLGNAFIMAQHILPQKKKELIQGCESFSTSLNRSEWLDWHGKRVFLDAYNANPSSMKVAVEEFTEYCSVQGALIGECLYILGDMNELGKNSENYHLELGHFLREQNIEHVIFFGQFAQFYQKGFNKHAKCFINKEELSNYLQSFAQNIRYIFVKGSRSLALESIFTK